MGVQLKPCPFCGKSDTSETVVVIDSCDREGWPMAFRCSDCGAKGPWHYEESSDEAPNARKGWNRRVPDPETTRRLEAAERLARAVRSARQLARASELVDAVRARDEALAAYESLSTPDAPADAAKEGAG